MNNDNNNEVRAMEIAAKFADYMDMAGWSPQSDFIEALADEIAAAMEDEVGEDLTDALEYAAQRIEI